MPTYVYLDGAMVDKATGQPMVDRSVWTPTVPVIVSDIDPYQSPVTGEYVGGRRSKRYDLESNNCIDADELGPSKVRGKFKNKRFAAKRGLKVSEEFQ